MTNLVVVSLLFIHEYGLAKHAFFVRVSSACGYPHGFSANYRSRDYGYTLDKPLFSYVSPGVASVVSTLQVSTSGNSERSEQSRAWLVAFSR
jgi:hypothetical protein